MKFAKIFLPLFLFFIFSFLTKPHLSLAANGGIETCSVDPTQVTTTQKITVTVKLQGDAADQEGTFSFHIKNITTDQDFDQDIDSKSTLDTRTFDLGPYSVPGLYYLRVYYHGNCELEDAFTVFDQSQPNPNPTTPTMTLSDPVYIKSDSSDNLRVKAINFKNIVTKRTNDVPAIYLGGYVHIRINPEVWHDADDFHRPDYPNAQQHIVQADSTGTLVIDNLCSNGHWHVADCDDSFDNNTTYKFTLYQCKNFPTDFDHAGDDDQCGGAPDDHPDQWRQNYPWPGIEFSIKGSGLIGKNPCVQQVSGGQVINACPTALGNIPTDISGFTGRILSIAIGLAGGIALILMVIGAIGVMTSSGDQQKLNAGRDKIVAAIAGLLFLIFSVLILKFAGIVLSLPFPT